MYLFCVSEPVDLCGRTLQQYRLGIDQCPVVAPSEEPYRDGDRGLVLDPPRLEPPAQGRATEQSIYFAYSTEFLQRFADLCRRTGRSIVRVLSAKQQRQVLTSRGMPPRLGFVSAHPGSLEAQIEAIRFPYNARIGIVNPFGLAIGDSLMAATAFREFHRRLVQRMPGANVTLFQHPDNVAMDQLYLDSGIVNKIHHLPTPLSFLTACDAYVDLSTGYWDAPEEETDGTSRVQLNWCDAVLELLGIDPGDVPSLAKRNHLSVKPGIVQELAPHVEQARSRRRPLLMFHPLASATTRSMPDEMVPKVLKAILAQERWTIVTVVPTHLQDSRIVDWSGLSQTFEHFNCFVSSVDAFVSVDTSVCHIADAHNVPGVVLYTWMLPRLRIAYYPFVEGVRLPDSHGVVRDSEGPHAIAAIRKSWAGLDLDEVLTVLNRVVSRRNRRIGDSANTTRRR